MNRQEAIKILKHSCDYIGLLPSEFWDSDAGIIEAIDMAIEALQREEAEEKGYCHRIMPSNVEVVVRCKECRKQGSDDCPMFSREWRVIMRGNECVDDFVFHDLTEPSGFCSYGERQYNYFGKRRE